MNLATDRLAANEPDIASKVIDGEAILINLRTGAYYSLRDAGALVWHGLREQRTRDEILDLLSTRYAEAGDALAADLDHLLTHLAAENLVRASSSAAPSHIDAPPLNAHEYGKPVLEKFTDMEELLALDPPTPGALDGLIRRGLD
jgi:hypothetical protein